MQAGPGGDEETGTGRGGDRSKVTQEQRALEAEAEGRSTDPSRAPSVLHWQEKEMWVHIPSSPSCEKPSPGSSCCFLRSAQPPWWDGGCLAELWEASRSSKPRAGPSQQHPNFSSKPREGIFFCPRQSFCSSDHPCPAPRTFPQPLHTKLPFPPAKAGPRHLHLKSAPCWGLLLPARPLAAHGTGFTIWAH